MAQLIDSLSAIVKSVWGLTESALRVVVLLLLVVTGWTFWRILPEVEALKMDRIRTEEQRRAEIDAIRDLTSEIKEYRKALVSKGLSEP